MLFIGSYTTADRPGIYAFRFDAATGALAACGSFTGIVNPSFLVVHLDQPWLYAISEALDGTPGSVWALRFERETCAIRFINQQPSGGDWPCHLQLDATGRWLLVSNYASGNVSVLPILLDGSLGEAVDVVQHQGASIHSKRQTGPHAHSTTLTPGNHFAIVADLGIDQLVVYRFDAAAGKLRPHAQTHTRPGAGPRHIAFHPSGERVYVANELDNTLSVYDAKNGRLREIQTIDTLPPGVPESFVAHIHVSASGERVYVSNRGHDSMTVFEVEGTGRLARIATSTSGGKWPRHFALAPNGRFMLVANQHNDAVCVLPVQTDVAELGDPCARADVTQPSCIQFVVG